LIKIVENNFLYFNTSVYILSSTGLRPVSSYILPPLGLPLEGERLEMILKAPSGAFKNPPP
jgi:hypothetical protein